MKLYTGSTTPFGRKAAIVAREHGIAVEEEACNPFESGELAVINPLKLIPVLVLDDGAVLHDSHLICEYFDSIGTGPTLYPEAGRWLWRTRMMVGHGLAEASVQLRLQQVLPDNEQSNILMTRYQGRMSRAVAVLEKQVEALNQEKLRMDIVCAVVGLGHLEFRHGEEWRDEAPRLSLWYDAAVRRPSLKETSPKG
jgi:glutathione S-transferase